MHKKCVFLFTRTISRNQRLQSKHRKSNMSMASQSECEKCFQTYVVIFTYIFSQVHWLSPRCFNVAAKLYWKKKRFSRGVLVNFARFLRFFSLEIFSMFSSWWHYRFRHRHPHKPNGPYGRLSGDGFDLRPTPGKTHFVYFKGRRRKIWSIGNATTRSLNYFV